MFRAFCVSVGMLLMLTLTETAILSNIFWLPVVPDLTLIAVLYFAFNNGRLMGETLGFVSGLCMDFLTLGPFGLNCLLRTILGYVCGLFGRSINFESVVVQFLTGVAATLAKALLLWCISLLYPSSVASYNVLSAAFGIELLANGILTPVFFRVLGMFGNLVLLRPEEVG